MKYIIRERMFSIGNKFDIKDEKGNNKLTVESNIFSFGNKLKIYDEKGNLKVEIKQKLLKILDEYNIIMNQKKVATITRKISIFRPRYKIDSIYGDYKVDGDILKHDFNIIKDRKIVAKIRKRYLSFSDKYIVDINEDENQSFILALVIVLDQVHHDGSVKNNNID